MLRGLEKYVNAEESAMRKDEWHIVLYKRVRCACLFLALETSLSGTDL